MKLAEALQERADLNRAIEQLHSRLDNNTLVQEGETPAESPSDLKRELDSSLERLAYLIAHINITNCQTECDGQSLTELIAKKDALTMLAEPVPLVIRNAPTRLMKELDYGKGYQYAHDTTDKLTDMQCLPDSLEGREYYRPTRQGVEGKFQDRLEQIKEWKRRHREEEEK